MENILNEIHGKFVKLPEEEVKTNKKILESVVKTFVNELKATDPLFKFLYRRVFYGGSFYDGLRVGKPEEFDLDLLLDIPFDTAPNLTESNIDGFVHLKLNNYDYWKNRPEAKPIEKNFRKLFDEEKYLSNDKVLRWMESTVELTMSRFAKFDSKQRILKNEHGEFMIKVVKGGPAMTLKVNSPNGMKMDIDLVACFVFKGDKWPTTFRSNPFPQSLPEFFIVPKRVRDKEQYKANQPPERYWRLTFQEQERQLLKNKERLKPACRLLKKMRSILQHESKISSYFIKTVFLHMIDSKNHQFWNAPLNHVYMTVLKEYKELIDSGNIPYYWNRNNNLIGHVEPVILGNISGRLGRIIKDLEKNSENREVVAKYFLTVNEMDKFLGVEECNQIQEEQSKCIII